MKLSLGDIIYSISLLLALSLYIDHSKYSNILVILDFGLLILGSILLAKDYVNRGEVKDV